MRNIVGFSACFFLCLFLVYSGYGQITLGAKAGLNANASKIEKFNSFTPAFNAGVFGRYKLASFVDAQLEVTYSQLGGDFKGYYEMQDLYHENPYLTYHTVEVPVLFQLTLPSLRESSSYPGLILGASYAYALHITERYTGTYPYFSGNATLGSFATDVTSDYNRHTVAFIGGVYYNLSAFGKPLQIDLRYRVNAKKVEVPSGDVRFSTISLNVAVSLFDL